MTDKEKAIVMAFTGICMLEGEKFDIFHKYVEDLMGRPVYTHEFVALESEIKKRVHDGFIALCRDEEPEQKVGKWVPCSERLPEDFQPVLVWYEYWHWKAEELKPEYGIGWRFRGLWCGDPGNGSRLRVIAWCELPEPPKEEQDADGTRPLSDTLGSDSKAD